MIHLLHFMKQIGTHKTLPHTTL